MKKKVKKQISNEEKLEFYKKYTDKEFLLELDKMQDKYFKIGHTAIKIFFSIGVIGMFFTPWIIFAFLPGFVIPIVCIHLSNKKHQEAVEKLTENITFDYFLEMVETGEWYEIAKGQAKDETKKQSPTSLTPAQECLQTENNELEFENTNNLEL